MECVEYRVLHIGPSRLNVVRLARCVLESKGARDSFEQRADFIVEAYRGAQHGWRQILRRDLQASSRWRTARLWSRDRPISNRTASACETTPRKFWLIFSRIVRIFCRSGGFPWGQGRAYSAMR
jgi:hypothetical protein